MLITVVSPKGGSGATTLSAIISHCMSRTEGALLVDACGGDAETIAGIETPARYSFTDWCVSSEPTSQTLQAISVPGAPGINVVSGSRSSDPSSQLSDYLLNVDQRTTIVQSLRAHGNCVVDVGTRMDALAHDIVAASDCVVMVLRECYMGLNRAVRHPFRESVNAHVVVHEGGRSISLSAIDNALSPKIVVELDARRDYAKVIDAGTLLSHIPKGLVGPVSAFLNDYMVHFDQPAPAYVSPVLSAEPVEESLDIFDTISQRNNADFWNETSQPVAPSRRVAGQSRLESYSRHVRAELGAS